jgi:phospholipase C
VDRATGMLTATLTNAGTAAIPFSVYRNAVQPFAAVPLVVAAGGREAYPVPGRPGGRYDLTVHGPNGFLRAFAGTAVPAGSRSAVPAVTARTDDGHLRLTLANTGHAAVRFTLASNDFGHRTESRVVSGGGSARLTWPTSDGWYDLTVRTDTDRGFGYRFAGRIERY